MTLTNIAHQKSKNAKLKTIFERDFMSTDSITEEPYWFAQAIAAPHQSRTVDVEGCPVHFLEWGDPEKPPLLFVHGARAHARWFAFVAPLLMDEFHVASMDLSGNGDSGWRDEYTGEIFSKEILSVAKALGPDPFVVGHSFGGMLTTRTAIEYENELAGIVLLDAVLRWPKPVAEAVNRPMREPRPTKVYEDFHEATGRFRLMPDQTCKNQFIMDYVGRHSLRALEGGYTWKFDHRSHEQPVVEPEGKTLQDLNCRVAAIWGSDSVRRIPIFTDITAEALAGKGTIYQLPGAQHHMMLDLPREMAAMVRDIIGAWVHEDRSIAA